MGNRYWYRNLPAESKKLGLDNTGLEISGGDAGTTGLDIRIPPLAKMSLLGTEGLMISRIVGSWKYISSIDLGLKFGVLIVDNFLGNK